jgi:hypothetical protein
VLAALQQAVTAAVSAAATVQPDLRLAAVHDGVWGLRCIQWSLTNAFGFECYGDLFALL